MSRNVEEIKEVINCDADAETKCKMISNILTANMSDIELVIKIPEEDYNFVKRQVADGITNPLKICIANGTPLPKGHGRLIDVREAYRKFYSRCLAGVAKEVLDETATIIESDKTEGEVQGADSN